MWISNFAIKKPVVTIVATAALVVFGALALFILDTDEFPEVNPPVVTVQVPYPGAAPEIVEREVIDEMEEAFASISGVDEIQSTATDGFAILTVTFDFDKDLQQASQDIRDQISEIRNDLPLEMEEPVITRFDPNDLPIVSITLSSPSLSQAALTRLADPTVTSALRGIPGVAEVELVGAAERELVVQVLPDALQAAGLGIAEVVQALQTQNLAAPVGRVTGDEQERTIRLRGRLDRPSDFEQLVVSEEDGRTIRLGEVAEIVDATEEPRSAAYFDGQPAVGIDVIKATNYSTTAVSTRIRQAAAALSARLPADVKLRIVRDAGERVEDSVNDVKASLIEGAALTVLVVFVFLASWRSTVITGLALPVSVLASFIAVWAFGFTLNTMSLLGLSLAIGILIDDAIVVRENIVRHMEMGKDHVTAAREGTSEIGLAVTATTLSIVVVFLPVAFMGGLAQQWMAPMALTIACSVLVSLFVSFSLDPMLSAAWPDPEVEGGEKSWLSRRLARFNRWFDRQTSRYRSLIGWALRHPGLMVLITLVAFGGALALPALGLVGSAFFPVQDRSEFNVQLETPPGSSLSYTSRKALQAAALARRRDDVAYTYTTVGGEGEVVDEAVVYVRLVPKSERRLSQAEIAETLRHQLRTIAGSRFAIETGGFDPSKQIQLELRGPDLDTLYALAARAGAMVETVPGAVDVALSTRGQKPELEVTVDRGQAGALGVTVAQVAQALRPAFAGIDAGDWVDPAGETRQVTVRLAPEARTRPADLERLPLVLPGPEGTSTTVPLGQVADVRRGLGPTQIQHLDRERVIVIGANTEGRPLSAVVGEIRAKMARFALPAGYALGQGGETEDQGEVFGRILTALAAAVLLMYFILVIQFQSFLDPIPIMASLPLSLIGVMLALLITGNTLNIMSMIGLILLMGIVAKNAILLIDFAKWARESGKDLRTAIMDAGEVRLRPILMTSFAIIAGMLPVAASLGEGAEFRAPLGIAVIGGIITSTLLTLLVIPTFYEILASGRDRLKARLSRPRQRVRTKAHPAEG